MLVHPAPAAPLIADPARGTAEITLDWGAVAGATGYLVQEGIGAMNWAGAVELAAPTTTSLTLVRRAGAYFYRVRAVAGPVSSDWSAGLAVLVTCGEPWTSEPARQVPDRGTLDVHRAMLTLSAARGDVLAVLSLPAHLRERAATRHNAALRAAFTGDERTVSFGAVYHPWPVVAGDGLAAARPIPPDGVTVGVIAARTLLRGAWVAPANEPMVDVVALTPELVHAEPALRAGRVNPLRQEPRGFCCLAAETLSATPDLTDISVRRLLALLRRTALRLAPAFVFESNDAPFRRRLRRTLEAVLTPLLDRGAFAGVTAGESYRVVVANPPNTAASLEQGRVIVELRVAPSVPLRFITVRLMRIGDRSVAVEG